MPIILTRPDAPMQRPGVGLVISSGEAEVFAGRNVAAFLGRSRMGPVNTPVRCTSLAQIQRIFGGSPYGGQDGGNTMDGAMEVLRGNPSAVWVVRMGGPDGVASKVKIGSLTFSALGPGTDGDRLSISVIGAPAAPIRQLAIYQRASIDAPPETATQVSVIPFAGDTDPAIENANFMNQFLTLGSDWLLSVTDETPALAMPQGASNPLVGGANPTITNADIAIACDALSASPWEVMAPDFVAEDEVEILRQKLNDWLFGGKLVMACVGTAPGKAWGAKTQQATFYNDPCIVVVGNGFRSTGHSFGSGVEITGYMSAGREAGRHAALPLARQLTHAVVRDGIQTYDEPSPDIIAEANAAGVYLYSTNERGAVWTEWGLTTYGNTLRPPQWAISADIGWRKSRLVLTRFRLLTDISLALSPLIETATNNNAGRASIIAQAQAVIDDQYIPSGAVTEGIVMQHPDYPPAGERFTMLIAPLTTPDGTEQLVVEARFRR